MKKNQKSRLTDLANKLKSKSLPQSSCTKVKGGGGGIGGVLHDITIWPT
jgi:hypothetical protein